MVGVASMLPNGPVLEFDRAKSNRVDSRVGDDPKSSKTINANDDAFDFTALSFTSNSVTGGSKFALAA